MFAHFCFTVCSFTYGLRSLQVSDPCLCKVSCSDIVCTNPPEEGLSDGNVRRRAEVSSLTLVVSLLASSTVYPLVIAAHPVEPNQFALGLSDGGVQVLEPLESEGKWGVGPPSDNGAPAGVPSGPTSGNQGSDQTPR
jgi:hypothetical protein